MEETSLSVVMETLRKRGYTEDFNIIGADIVFARDGQKAELHDLVIDRIYRFEGMTDMEDESILYAISCKTHDKKGLLVNGYGIYTDDTTNKIVEMIERNKDAE